MKVLIIIPAYNEQDNIERVVKHLTENYPEYDYVVINDGSMDKTSEICHSNHYNIIDLPVNLGLAGMHIKRDMIAQYSLMQMDSTDRNILQQ